MAKLAIIVPDGDSGPRERQLGRVFDFFGVPWKVAGSSELNDLDRSGSDYVVFGSIRAVAAVLKANHGATPPVLQAVAYYTYADDERARCETALHSLLGDASVSLQDAPSDDVAIQVSDEFRDLAGPMAGIKFSLRMRRDDAVLTGAPISVKSKCSVIILAGADPIFVRFQNDRAPIYFCTSSQMIDVDQPITKGFYDVKDQFCSAVPMVMFIKFMFPEVAWQPQELGACLIIDDPLLKNRYGFCDFHNLRDLMLRQRFTTNIAFIPWNWRRTSSAASKFFNSEAGLFSISIHGCDHTAGEFGADSFEVLCNMAQLARSRMRSHQERTGIEHDSVMVFPQGVFSSACPEVLKENCYLAAVNTEINPVDVQNAHTRIRDVWDVAIMAYGAFPIFTRRYAFHGLENFAFDLLLGKPCLIVAHHDSFEDDGAGLVKFIATLGSLNCHLRWGPLGQVIRVACRRRASGAGMEEVEMYGNELVISNPSDQAVDVRIRKRKSQNDFVSEILCDEKPIRSTTDFDYFVFGTKIESQSEMRFRVVYREQHHPEKFRRSLRFEVGVAARRILSEFRDDFLFRSRFVRDPAARFKSVFRKAL